MDSQNILITGGSGFLGQHLTKQLLDNFPRCRITILDQRPPANPLFDFSSSGQIDTLLNRDIRRYESIASDLKNTDIVIHLAGVVSFSIKDRKNLFDVNVTGSANVLKAARQHNIKQFIHISSVAALGYKDHQTHLVTEEFRFDWTIAEKRKKFYMLTKHLADLEVQKYISAGGSAAILYPGLMFGPGDITNSAKLINAVKNRKIPFNTPGGTNIVDVRDAAAGIVLALKKNIAGEHVLLSGFNLPFTRINKTIAKALNVRPPSLTLPRCLNNPLFRMTLLIESASKHKLALTADNLDSAFKFRYFDSSKAAAMLSWQPKISFQQTIEDTIDWMKKNDLFEK